ncbi:MAG: aminotransferase class III-fold pyridoxal phosphate-dependent enzyme, partial [Anaerolineales bacterium]|nr:aminotransferase class III-fold pyridoxal phosphate-dependent enzyme [Anaerolineales bacterium]
VAMKMAWGYWRRHNQPKRRRFLTFDHAYHGDTTGAMSLCDPVDGMHDACSGAILQQIHSPLPVDPSSNERFRSIVENHQHELAAVFIEPLVQAAGGMRDAQSLLDQLASTGTKITLALAQQVLGTATSQTVLDVIASILDHQPARGLETIHHALDSGADPRSLARQLVEYTRGLMLIQMGNMEQVEATRDVKTQMQTHADSFNTSDTLRMMKIFNTAATDLRGGWQPSLSLELALAEILDAPTESTPQSTSKPKSVSKVESKPEVKSQAAPKKEATSPSEKAIINSNDIVKAWKSLIATLPKSQANLGALLNSVRMIDVQGKALVLGMASEVLVEKLNKPDQIEIIQRLIKDNFGADVAVRCVVTNAKGKLPANISGDGMVATAIQHGGEVVDMDE